MLKNLGFFSEKELDVYNQINNQGNSPDSNYLEELLLLFKKIRTYNLTIGEYNRASLDSAITSKLLLVCGRIKNFKYIFNLNFSINFTKIFFRIKFKYKVFLIKKIFIKRRL